MKIRVELTFFITIIILLLTNDVKTILLMLFSAFVHELGHIAMLKILRVGIEELNLGLFGGTLVLEKRLISYQNEALVALSGPIANLISAAVFFILLRQGFSDEIFFLFLCNIFYAIFNLLPIASLDGGCALRAILSSKKELYDAERISFQISRVTLFALALASTYLVSASTFNVSLLILSLLFYAENS